MERVCYRLKVHPGLLDEYVARQQMSWSEMRAALERVMCLP
jgi:L-rhamnose mutarotase